MPPANPTQFKSVTSLGDSQFSDQLKTNLIAFFDWSFLQVGGFFNVTFPAAATSLRRASDPDYDDGQVYEGYRQEWVWESGVSYQGYSPVAVSGVWVNGVLQPYGSGYHIDYPGGRVVFDNPLASGASVQAEYSVRTVRMAASDADWFQQLQFDTLETLNSPDPQFVEVASGSWNVLSQNRVQLPAIVVEPVNRVDIVGLELGSTARVHRQDVVFHVLADTNYDASQLHDVVISQWDHRIQLFDKNAVENADAWPLDANGTPTASPLSYPQLVAATGDGGFRWRACAVVGMRSEPQTSFPPLYRATCRGTFEVDIP